MSAPSHRPRLAVVLFNLGGPDSPGAIKPFLVNLFTDPAILRVPAFLRGALGRFIAGRRLKPATENYALVGGRSPLLELTRQQADALEAALSGEFEARCFVAMRYWHPFSAETVAEVAAWEPDEAVLLPLYPQYSTTTTGSSLDDWQAACAAAGLRVPATALCCWHSDPGFAASTAAILRRAWEAAREALAPDVPLRILFSAHGLPESIVKRGDPYQWQVERSVEAVMARLGLPGAEHRVCYQSRATPQTWIGPSTEEAIGQAARDRVAVLVCPIAFVSEHSETLVELDMEYRDLADKEGVPGYFRVPAQNADPDFIAALAGLVRQARDSGRRLCSWAGGRQCPKAQSDCPHARAAQASLTGRPGGRRETVPARRARGAGIDRPARVQ